MQTFRILLLLLLCIAICPAFPNSQENGLRQIGSNEGNIRPPYAFALRRQTRSVGGFISNEIQQLVWTIIRIPIMIIGLIANVFRDVIFAILDVFQVFLYPFRKIISGFVRTKRENRPGLVESVLLDLPQIIFHPFEFVENSIKTTSNFARNQTVRVVQKVLRIGWRFLCTAGLPWLRRILDQIARMPTTPDNVRTLVKNFDSMYNIFQMLGYISPAY